VSNHQLISLRFSTKFVFFQPTWYFGILLPNTGYTWTPGIATHFLFLYDYNYWEYVIECVFAVEGHIILKNFQLKLLSVAIYYFVSTLYMYSNWNYQNLPGKMCRIERTPGIATHFLFLYDYNYWEYVIECVFAVEGHIILKIWLILRI
jgi:hypothetical protein